MTKTLIWKNINEEGLEHCEIDLYPITKINGKVISIYNNKPLFVEYEVLCENNGATKEVNIRRNFDGISKTINIRKEKNDIWYLNDKEIKECKGLKDIDIGITPSTNLLPIRRLNLSIGERKEVTALWVRFPDLTLAPLKQAYERLDANKYEYESVDSGYKAILLVDESSIVIDYKDEWIKIN